MDPTRRSYAPDDPIRIDTLGQGHGGGEHRGPGPPDWRNAPPPGAPGAYRDPAFGPPELVFTPEDLRILRECNRESFYRRCLPLLIAGNALTHTWFNRAPEPLSRNKRMSGHFIVSVAMWITGKLSYRRTCEEKLVTSGYSSRLVDSIRKRRGITSTESELSGDYYGDDNQTMTFDWKEDDRQSVMKDDHNRSQQQFGDGPTGDKPFYGDDDMSPESRREFTSYDVLRQQNRARAVPPAEPRPRTPEDRRF